MTIRMGIVSVRGDAYPPTRRLLEAIRRRGHSGVVLDPYRWWPAVGPDGNLALHPISGSVPQVVLPRQGAEIGPASLAFLRFLEDMGVVLVNRCVPLSLARDQFSTLRVLAGRRLPVPETVLVNHPKAVASAVDAVGGFPLVVKLPSGRQGSGVWRMDTLEELRAKIAQHCRDGRYLLVQRYLATEGRRDLRLLVVGGDLLGAVELAPQSGDFRANYHLTGRAAPVTVYRRWRELALQAVAALGLDIAGVDLMLDSQERPWLMEVNYAPGFTGMEAATGIDVADAIIAHAERCLRRTGGRPPTDRGNIRVHGVK